MSVAEALITLAGWWLTIGAVVAAVFLTVGIDRIDEDARDAYVFRPILIPAILLIWPLVLWQWQRLEQGDGDWAFRYRPLRAAHLPVAIALAASLALAVIVGLTVRQSWPADTAPVKLSEAGT